MKKRVAAGGKLIVYSFAFLKAHANEWWCALSCLCCCDNYLWDSLFSRWNKSKTVISSAVFVEHPLTQQFLWVRMKNINISAIVFLKTRHYRTWWTMKWAQQDVNMTLYTQTTGSKTIDQLLFHCRLPCSNFSAADGLFWPRSPFKTWNMNLNVAVCSPFLQHLWSFHFGNLAWIEIEVNLKDPLRKTRQGNA